MPTFQVNFINTDTGRKWGISADTKIEYHTDNRSNTLLISHLKPIPFNVIAEK